MLPDGVQGVLVESATVTIDPVIHTVAELPVFRQFGHRPVALRLRDETITPLDHEDQRVLALLRTVEGIGWEIPDVAFFQGRETEVHGAGGGKPQLLEVVPMADRGVP